MSKSSVDARLAAFDVSVEALDSDVKKRIIRELTEPKKKAIEQPVYDYQDGSLEDILFNNYLDIMEGVFNRYDQMSSGYIEYLSTEYRWV